EDVRRELLALVRDLPSLLSGVGAAASALSGAIELYQACVEFVCESPAELVLPLLRHVGTRGNTTVYEWRTGLQPRRVERPRAGEAPEQPQEDTVPPTPPVLGRPRPALLPGTRGSGCLSPGFHGGVSPRGGYDQTVQAMEPPPLPHSPPAHPPVPEGVACGPDALTILENSETRSQFIDELMELELFLAQRLVEMEEEADVVAISQFQLAPPVLQGQTSAHVGSLLGSTRALLGQLCSRRMQHLFIILASPRS
ncbi:CK5P3 protein, partial [Chordeiles acutipennis]|nr:CK5P3 protein [Chordeiles acutipennis]